MSGQLQRFHVECSQCSNAIAGFFHGYNDFVDTIINAGWRISVLLQKWYCPECAKKGRK